jgi:hypothetical protein
MKGFQHMTKNLLMASAALALAFLPGLAAASAPDGVLQMDLTATPPTPPKKVTPAAVPAATKPAEVAVPRTAPAPARAPASEVGNFELGGTAGLGFGSGWTSFRVNAGPQYTILQLAPNIYMDIAGHAGLAFGSGLTLIEIVPAARFRYLLNDTISFYGDGGFGIGFASLPSVNVGGVEYGGGSQTWGIFRIASGIHYKVTPTIDLVGEPVGLNIYFGTGSSFVYSLAVGALFKL